MTGLAQTQAADDPEAVYGKLHAAALAGNLEEVRLYIVETQRAHATLPDVPKRYRVTGKAARGDGNAVELRAAATADSPELGYTQMFGVVGLAREAGEWKVDHLSWSPQRPGEYPEGYVIVEGPAPAPRAEPRRFAPPASAPERSRIVTPKLEAEPAAAVLEIERAAKRCVIKPVMTDDDLRACGARIAD